MTRCAAVLVLLVALACFGSCESSESHKAPLILEFPEGSCVPGLAQFGSLLGVVVDKELVLYKIPESPNGVQDVALVEERRFSIDVQNHDCQPLLEFKLLDAKSALICTYRGCWVCDESVCRTLTIDDDASPFSAISAVSIDNKIVVRAVRLHANASIYVLEPSDGFYEQTKSTMDHQNNQNITAVASFATPDYTYFVGSARRKDLPLKLFADRINTEVRITRICNGDQTENLESRIDMVLSCEGIPYDDIMDSVENTATAATYVGESAALLVAMRVGGTENVICEYDFKELQQRFDRTWEMCQDTVNHYKRRSECQKFAAYSQLPEQCFLITYALNEKIPYCEAFNGALEKRLGNCELHTSSSTSKRYGHLENFKPFIGKRFYHKKESEMYISIREGTDRDTLFGLKNNNRLYRLFAKGAINEELTWRAASTGPHMLELFKENADILFVDPQFEKDISVLHSSCPALYPNCEDIKSEDPLECGYCANSDGTGTVMREDKLKCNSGIWLRNICPPIINKVALATDGYWIDGKRLDSLKNAKVTICNKECLITSEPRSETLKCSASVTDLNCNVTVTGELNSQYPVFTVSKLVNADPKSGGTADNDKPQNHSRLIRIIVFCIVGGILVVVIIMIYCYNLRKNAEKLHMKPSKPSYGVTNFALERYNPVSPGIQLDEFDGVITMDQLYVIRQIGKGNFSTVHYGRFYPNPNNRETYQDVAVKRLNNLNVNDARDEIKLSRNLEHPHVLRFVGWAWDQSTPLMVSEYMSGGSLQAYLLDEQSRPTIGDCFNFIEQIVDGMAYLHSQHIIHRDLATRNCLLDATHTLLKIADFGLSRRTDDNYVYISMNVAGQVMPYKWLAPEVLSGASEYTRSVDVWAFGITVWELFERGATPYDGMDANAVRQFLAKGHRLPRHKLCPELLYVAMQGCWDQVPEKRPTFEKLKTDIACVLGDFRKVHPEEMSYEYERPTPVCSFPPTPFTVQSNCSIDHADTTV